MSNTLAIAPITELSASTGKQLRRAFLASFAEALAGTALFGPAAIDLTIGWRSLLHKSRTPFDTHLESEQLRKSCTLTDVDLTHCHETSGKINDIVPVWLDMMRRQGRPVPDYIDLSYALRCAGIESIMHPESHRPGSRYLGLFQFSPDGGAFKTIENDLLAYLRIPSIKEQIPALKNVATITPDIFKNLEIFQDVHVQLAALMFEALRSNTYLQRYPQFADLDFVLKQSFLYLRHVVPDATRMVAKNLETTDSIESIAQAELTQLKAQAETAISSEDTKASTNTKARPVPALASPANKNAPPPNHGVVALARDIEAFKANPAIFGRGLATSAEILYRIAEFTQPFIKAFHPEPNNLRFQLAWLEPSLLRFGAIRTQQRTVLSP
jgi:hypothetical protein